MSEQPAAKRTGSKRIRRKFELKPETERRYDREDRQAKFLAMRVEERKQRFLAAYEANYGLSSRACKDIGCPYGDIPDWRDNDDEFRERMDELAVQADDQLRDHIMRRAMGLDGERPSDLLAIFEAKRRMPQYRDKEQSVNVHIEDRRTQNMVVLTLDDLRQGVSYLEGQTEPKLLTTEATQE